jgi:hypothetical protein
VVGVVRVPAGRPVADKQQPPQLRRQRDFQVAFARVELGRQCGRAEPRVTGWGVRGPAMPSPAPRIPRSPEKTSCDSWPLDPVPFQKNPIGSPVREAWGTSSCFAAGLAGGGALFLLARTVGVGIGADGPAGPDFFVSYTRPCNAVQ